MNKPFDFDKNDITRTMLDFNRKSNKAFDYIYDKLKSLGHHYSTDDKIELPDNESFIESGLFMEGKNYHWTTISCKDVDLLIRKYAEHFTVYLKWTKKTELKDFDWFDKKYSCFEIYTDTGIEYDLNKAGKSEFKDFHEDFFYCNPFYDFNHLINKIIDLARDGYIHGIWNSVTIPRPERVRLKLYYSGESFESIDKTIYAFEELSTLNEILFAENEMPEKLKDLKVGDNFGNNVISEIKTEVKNDYYHNVGIKTDDNKFIDVYSLTKYYFDNVFNPDKVEREKIVDPITKHYTEIVDNEIRKAENKADLTYIKEMLRTMPQSMDKVGLFYKINLIEAENK